MELEKACKKVLLRVVGGWGRGVYTSHKHMPFVPEEEAAGEGVMTRNESNSTAELSQFYTHSTRAGRGLTPSAAVSDPSSHHFVATFQLFFCALRARGPLPRRLTSLAHIPMCSPSTVRFPLPLPSAFEAEVWFYRAQRRHAEGRAVQSAGAGMS
jgi:hypothetical protein